jgi:hypothetical protein
VGLLAVLSPYCTVLVMGGGVALVLVLVIVVSNLLVMRA